MTKKLLLPAILFVGIIITLVVFTFFSKNMMLSGQEIKTPHFTDSTPLHVEVYAAQPVNITVNFNFDLVKVSAISVNSSNKTEWTEGEVLIEDNGTALKKNLKQGMPDGDYLVNYKACWVDGSCHDGQFSFTIDSAKKSEYADLTGQSGVEVKMENLKFAPAKIIISKGTKIVWENTEEVGHFVNTETHPEHTYYLAQNSRELANDQNFSVTFQTPGQYNYHCSAHVPQGMLGSLIVVN